MSIEGQGHFFTIYFPGFVCFVLYWAKISGERLQDHWSSGFSFGIRINWTTKLRIRIFLPPALFITHAKLFNSFILFFLVHHTLLPSKATCNHLLKITEN